MTKALRLGFIIVVAASCVPKQVQSNRGDASSGFSSIQMPIPSKIKPYVSADKINGYRLQITPGTCDQGVTGTKVAKVEKLDQSGAKLANEKLKQGCDYTVVLFLGKLDASGTKLSAIYLTNSQDSDRTPQITKVQSKVSPIKITIMLSVTTEGQSVLGIDGSPVPTPSDTQSDVDINIDINGSQNNGGGNSLQAGDYDWRSSIQLTDVPVYGFSGNDYGSPYYKDVMTHTSPGQQYLQGSKEGLYSTDCHETLHGLHNDMYNKTSETDMFVYFENGKGAYIKSPKPNRFDVQYHVGASFRSIPNITFTTYLQDRSTGWEDTLYLFDEWSAYIGTARSALELKRAGKVQNRNSDPIAGLADFVYYGSAALISIKKVDPNYLKDYPQFKAAYAMLMEQSLKYLQLGQSDFPESYAKVKLENLKTAPDSVPVRDAIRELMGSVWMQRVLGIQG